MSTRAEILEQLKTAGVSCACVTFDGCGDSGSIENVELTVRRAKNEVTNVSAKYPELVAALTDLCEKELEATDIDWYNHDGGFGDYCIDLEKDKISFIVYTRYTETNLEHYEIGLLKDWTENKTEHDSDAKNEED